MDIQLPDSDHVYNQLELIASHIPTTDYMAVVTIDGLSIATWFMDRSKHSPNPDDRLTVITAALEGFCRRRTRELDAGQYKLTVLKGTEGSIILIAISEAYVLSLGVQEFNTIDSVLIILQQWWGELLRLLDVSMPEL